MCENVSVIKIVSAPEAMQSPMVKIQLHLIFIDFDLRTLADGVVLSHSEH